LDNTLLSISEEGKQVTKQHEYQLKTIKCNRCTETLSPTQQFCGRCGLTTTLAEQYTKELDLERENKELKIIEEKQKEKEFEIQIMKQQIQMLTESQKEILECLKYPERLSHILNEK
jgi:hypothetical protein